MLQGHLNLAKTVERRLAASWCDQNSVRQYGTVVNALAKQLNSASNSVENLGTRARAMSRKLKDVELLSDLGTTDKLLDLSDDEIVSEEEEQASSLLDESVSDIIVRKSRPSPAKH